MAEHPLYRCRGGWAAEGLFQQVMEYFEISFLLSKEFSLKAKDLSHKTKDLSLNSKDMSLRTPTLAIDSFYQ